MGVPESQDCLLVKLLLAAGAIPFVRTNVPPVLMAWETANNVFGETLNPWNTTRIAGGSSGGEAALISVGASPLGVGQKSTYFDCCVGFVVCSFSCLLL